MCTDDQWTLKAPSKIVCTSAYWIIPSKITQFSQKQYDSFWLTPLDVPKTETGFFLRYPPRKQSNAPAKYR